jgi:hypothetical protein
MVLATTTIHNSLTIIGAKEVGPVDNTETQISPLKKHKISKLNILGERSIKDYKK